MVAMWSYEGGKVSSLWKVCKLWPQADDWESSHTAPHSGLLILKPGSEQRDQGPDLCCQDSSLGGWPKHGCADL